MRTIPLFILLLGLISKCEIFAQASGTYRNYDGSWGTVKVDQNGNGTWRGYDGNWGTVKLGQENQFENDERPHKGLISTIFGLGEKKEEKEYYEAKSELARIQLKITLNEYADLITRNYIEFNKVDPKGEEALSLRKALGEMIEADPRGAGDKMIKFMKEIHAESESKNKAQKKSTPQEAQATD